MSFLAFAWLALPISPAHGDPAEYQWFLLEAQNDSRDPEVRAQDAAWSRNLVFVMNQSENLFRHSIVWKEISINKLLDLNVPFCEMHFDAVKPFELTTEEKSILMEYLRRGGFVLFFIDAYPYDQDEFWNVKEWPLIDFLKKELPATPGFTASRVPDDFPLFKIHYQADVSPALRHELDDNPNTPNRIGVFYRGRLCAFVMGNYNVLEDGKWIATPRPFSRDFNGELSGYERIVNVYVYSIVQ